MPSIKTHRIPFFAACTLIAIAALTLAQQKSTRSRSLKFIPRDALVVVAVDIQSLMASQMLSANAAEIGEQFLPTVQIPLSKVTDVTFVMLNGGAYAKFNFTAEGKQLLWKRINAMGKETEVDKVKCFVNRDGVFHQLEDGSTLLANNAATLLRALKTESADSTTWASQWNASKSPVVALLNTSLLRATTPSLEKLLLGEYGTVMPNRDIVSVASKSDRVWIEFQPDPVPALSVRGQCVTPEEAMSFESGLRTAISLARNLISAARTGVLDPRGGSNGDVLPLLDFMDKSLEFATVQRKESQVAALARVSDADSKRFPSLLTLAMRAFSRGRNAAVSQINLRQISLAMHNYQSDYRQFPAAVQEGPNKIPRSWRVTILPYIGQTGLYNKYKQDEPWDSPSNIKLLQEIPKAYQGSKGGTNSAYFVFDGVNAMFDGNKGPSMNEIRDGLANTILVVETELDIPWTKPEDIPFDAKQELPAFVKQGFLAATADGRNHFIPANSDEKAIREAIMKNDPGENQLFRDR